MELQSLERHSSELHPLECDASMSDRHGPEFRLLPERKLRDEAVVHRDEIDASMISLLPETASSLVQSRRAVLIDIRTIEERRNGYPDHSVHIPWRLGSALLRNPRFQKMLRDIADEKTVVLLICRSGRRSLEAAAELRKVGFVLAFDVAEGCDGVEGAPSPSGWRAKGLPWIGR